MKRILIIVFALIMVVVTGCGKKESEPDKKLQTSGKRVSRGYLIDPVENKPVDISASKYSYIYKDCEYNFNTKDNMDKFIKNPEKYIKTD